MYYMRAKQLRRDPKNRWELNRPFCTGFHIDYEQYRNILVAILLGIGDT
jgi:hypothetical protein